MLTNVDISGGYRGCFVVFQKVSLNVLESIEGKRLENGSKGAKTGGRSLVTLSAPKRRPKKNGIERPAFV